MPKESSIRSLVNQKAVFDEDASREERRWMIKSRYSHRPYQLRNWSGDGRRSEPG
jgi:hypothetical protein